METKNLKISDIKLNDYNPNQMIDDTYSHLTNTIKDFGYLQDILVWQKDNEYIVIDGEHRFRAYSELNNPDSEIQVKILTNPDLLQIGHKLKESGRIDCDITEANIDKISKVLTLLMNSIKGENNPVKLAKLYQDLQEDLNIENLASILNTSVQDIESYKTLLSMSDEELQKELSEGMDKLDDLKQVQLMLTEQEYNIYQQAVKKTGIDKEKEAFLQIVRSYLQEKE